MKILQAKLLVTLTTDNINHISVNAKNRLVESKQGPVGYALKICVGMS